MRGIRFHLARVTIETEAPLSIGTGRGSALVDSVCVTDANGLPTIPGTAIAGILRHALASRLEESEAGRDPARHRECRRLFGFQERSDGSASLVEVSFGQVHDASDRPVPFRAGRIDARDEVLQHLRVGVRRDHVAIDERGVVDERRKYDLLLAPRGARFTFELRVEAAGDPDRARRDAELLLDLLASGVVRVGARTRAGLGAFRVVRVHRRSFDLTQPADRDRYRRLPRELAEPVPNGCLEAYPVRRSAEARIELMLAAEDHWIFGGGEPARAAHAREDRGETRVADMIPFSERAIRWRREKGADRGGIVACTAVVPASSVKGALRHRFAYHARRREGALVRLDAGPLEMRTQSGSAGRDATDAHPAVQRVFGCVKQGAAPGTSGGCPGKVFLDDLFLLPDDVAGTRDAWLDHVSIDRFTGGALDAKLFSEAPIFGGNVRLVMRVDREGLGPEDGWALGETLRDLCGGRLALGAGGSRGHGFFRGEIVADESIRSWLEGRG
jgi:CRISPR/Cas system CSM-associated protein Csm3 (group 7 of RAMP superfamily)